MWPPYITRYWSGILTIPQCCSPELNGGSGWGFFKAILGWTNSATYGSVISYNLYWLAVIIAFVSMRHREVKGHWPLLKPKNGLARRPSNGGSSSPPVPEGKAVATERTVPS